jgi:hypothetical protein
MEKSSKKRKPALSFETSLENMIFDDQIPLNSTRKDREETMAIINKYKDVDDVSNVDLKNLMIATLQGQLRTSDQISSIKSNLRATKTVVDENSKKISQHDTELAELQAENLILKSEVNAIKQQEFENQVILTGFPGVP